MKQETRLEENSAASRPDVSGFCMPDSNGVYSHEMRGIMVSVTPSHAESGSYPERGIYCFNYYVTITNTGTETVRLLERYWLVKSGGRQLAEVVGPGVVGVQPVLEPQSSFQYTSSIVIRDTQGSMEGSYTFRSETGQFFNIAIPRFDLLYPLVVH